MKTSHTIMCLAIVRLLGYQEVVNLSEAFFAIVIVSVDHGKGGVHHAAAAEHSLTGAPGLFAVRRTGIAIRKVMEILEDIGERPLLFPCGCR